MSVINNNLLLTAAAGATGYQVSRSLRFNSSDSAYLSRTPASAGNRKTWTWAGWVKRGSLGSRQIIFGNLDSGATLGFDVEFIANDSLDIYDYSSGFEARRTTTQVFRDCSAWYHIVIVYDSTNAIAADRLRLYVNGARVTTFANSTDPTLNADGRFNTAVQTSIGRTGAYDLLYFSGYLADIHFIDGQALTPSSFTEVSATTGQLIPKAYTGSFGTNGFQLKFADNSNNTATTLGKDTSPNGNNWTPVNLSVTAGAGNDSLVDTPTSVSATDTGIGGEIRGNYCTWNPLDNAGTLANGNLDFSQASAAFRNVRSTFAVSSGKWYWEGTLSAIGGAAYIGIGKSTADLTVNIGGTDTWGYVNDGKKQSGNTAAVSYGASYTTGDVIGVAFDADNGTLTFYKNGTSQGQAYSGLTSGPYFMMVTGYNGTTWAANFGQRAFAYTAPSGFKALCDTNLPAPVVAKPNTVMDVKLYTGNGSTQNITGLGFSPDFIWIKARSQPYSNTVFDVIRGATNYLYTDTTGAEGTGAQFLTAFNSDGFSLGTNAAVNQSSTTYAAWTWDAGSSTVTNTQGSITSSVRANQSSGFSVIGWTGASSGTATIGHGLGIAPAMIIVRPRNATSNWVVYHRSVGNDAFLRLNTTDASVSSSACFGTGPTSTVFTLNQGSLFGIAGDYIGYAFAPVTGYSSFGSYTGNGSTDGPFVYTGFRPRWVLVKPTNITNFWAIMDSARDPYNSGGRLLYPNSSIAEEDYTTSYPDDFLSNGFKPRNAGTQFNASGTTYIYAAFAESPFQFSRAR